MSFDAGEQLFELIGIVTDSNKGPLAELVIVVVIRFAYSEIGYLTKPVFETTKSPTFFFK